MENISQLLPRDKEYPIKCNAYMDYIDDHRARVKTAYCKYFKDKLPSLLEGIIDNFDKCEEIDRILNEKIDKHDMSKYSDMEFDGYRIKFFPTSVESEIINHNSTAADIVKEEFQEAWIHHQQVNSHHPHFYLWNVWDSEDGRFILQKEMLSEPSRDMRITDILEMICDWAAMSKGDDDFNYISWIASKDSDTEVSMMTDMTKRIFLVITSKILPSSYETVRDILIERFGVEDKMEE